MNVHLVKGIAYAHHYQPLNKSYYWVIFSKDIKELDEFVIKSCVFIYLIDGCLVIDRRNVYYNNIINIDYERSF